MTQTLTRAEGLTSDIRNPISPGGAITLTQATEGTNVIAIEPAESSLAQTLRRLHELQNLQPNWDSYNGLPPTEKAISTASDFLHMAYEYLHSVAKIDARPYRIAALPDGGIHLRWKRPQAETEVEFSPEGIISFIYVEKENGEDKYTLEDEDVPMWMVLAKIVDTLQGQA